MIIKEQGNKHTNHEGIQHINTLLYEVNQEDEEWDNCTDSDGGEEDSKDQTSNQDKSKSTKSTQKDGNDQKSDFYKKKRNYNTQDYNDYDNQNYHNNNYSNQDYHHQYDKKNTYGGYQRNDDYNCNKHKTYQRNDKLPNDSNTNYNDSNYVCKTESSLMNNNTSSSNRYEKDFVNTNSSFAKKPGSKRAHNYQSTKKNSNSGKGYYNNSNANRKREEEEITKPMFINSKLSNNQEEHFIALEKNPYPEEVPKLNLIPSTELDKEYNKKNEVASLDSEFEKKYNSGYSDKDYSNKDYNNSHDSYYQKYNRGSKGNHNIYQPEQGYHQTSKNYNGNRNDLTNKFNFHGGDKRGYGRGYQSNKY